MFCFSIPANYYYVVLALVPALLVRAAMTAPGLVARLRDWGVLMAFALFWLSCGVWICAWLPWQQLRQLVTRRSAQPRRPGSRQRR